MKIIYYVPTTKQNQEQDKAIVKRLFPASSPQITQRATGTSNIDLSNLDSLADLLDAQATYSPFVTFTIDAPEAGYSQEQEQFLMQPGIEVHNQIDPEELLSAQEQKFLDEMDTKRRVTLMMAGVSESDLNADQLAALDAYMAAYKAFYLSKWGLNGPRGAVLRMETEEETRTREAWEDAIKPLQKDDEED